MKTMKTGLIAGLSVSALLLLAGCTGETQAAAGDDRIVKVATQRQPHLFAAYAYEQFAPEGVIIEVVPMSNSTDEKNALLSGDVDFALLGVPTIIAGAAQGEEIELIASGADGGSGIIGKSDITSTADLRGKKIGYVPGSSQEIVLRLTLAAEGIDPDTDVEMINIGYAEMADALSRGDIDAFSGAEVGASIAKLAGAVSVTSPYETGIGRVNIGLATNSGVMDSDAELVEAMVETHIKATNYLLGDKQAWVDGVQNQFTFDPEVLDSAVGNIWLRSSLDDEYIAQVDELARQMVAIGSIDSAPAITDYLHTQFLEASATAGTP